MEALLLLILSTLSSSYGLKDCPTEGVRVSGERLESRKELEPGWEYWQQCSRRCQASQACKYWTLIILPGDYKRHTCELYSTKTGTSESDIAFSGSRHCVELESAPTETTYIPGEPGAPWTPEEISVTRQRILEMLRPELETQQLNFGKRALNDWGENVHATGAKVTENSLLQLGFHDCHLYEDGTGGCDGCLNWENMGFRRQDRVDPRPEKTDNNGFSRLTFWLERLYSRTNWPFSYNQTRPSLSLKDSGKSRADLWMFASWVALERAVERADHACDHDYFGRQQVPILEGKDKCYFKLDKPYKLKYGRRDCLPTDSVLPYKTLKTEVHPLVFGNGDETVDFMSDQFKMPPEQFIALLAVHALANHGVTVSTRYHWFGPSYLSNMYHKRLASRPTYRIEGGTLGLCGSGQNDGVFGRHNATFQIFTGIGASDGGPNPQDSVRWRVFCNYERYSDGGPCTWRPAQYRFRSSCFDGFDEEGRRTVRNTSQCSEAWIDEEGFEHDGMLVAPDEDINEHWVGEFGLSMEFGTYLLRRVNLYKKFDIEDTMMRPVGCPGIDFTWEEMPHDNKNFKYSNIEECPLNDYAPSGRALHQIVEDLADDHDYFGRMFLEGFERMTTNGYTDQDLNDAVEEGWFGYYTMAGQDRFSGFMDNFEEYIVSNGPVVMADPAADPYVTGSLNPSSDKARMRFSDVARFAEEQFKAPLDFRH